MWLCVSIYRSTQTRATSCTAKGRSSTSANPSSTSSRSVSGCRRCWRKTSRTRTRTTVKPSPHSAHRSQLLQHNMQLMFLTPSTPPHLLSNQVLAPLWHRSACMCKRGLGLHPPLLRLPSSPQKEKPARKTKTNLRCEQPISSLCCWIIRTSAPSGGQIEDQHHVRWAIRLHLDPGHFHRALSQHKISLRWRSVYRIKIYLFESFARFFWSPFADQPADNCVHEYDYCYLFLRISLFSVVSMSGCPAASVFSCLTKRGHNVCCYLKKKKKRKPQKKQCLYKNGMKSYFPSSCFLNRTLVLLVTVPYCGWSVHVRKPAHDTEGEWMWIGLVWAVHSVENSTKPDHDFYFPQVLSCLLARGV